ncbi:hypothetical protein PoB_000383300 [Plakobranchus ocellatus]|uniref:Uncharacterized protein n=1 Tax=Plakobranchus ocellatus TaxID=259542 RepID=A0AAV3Y428_9GAST|nr:hypothetical protein PoB_000383300 [Plakobranchus ocellatus]
MLGNLGKFHVVSNCYSATSQVYTNISTKRVKKEVHSELDIIKMCVRVNYIPCYGNRGIGIDIRMRIAIIETHCSISRGLYYFRPSVDGPCQLPNARVEL